MYCKIHILYIYVILYNFGLYSVALIYLLSYEYYTALMSSSVGRLNSGNVNPPLVQNYTGYFRSFAFPYKL